MVVTLDPYDQQVLSSMAQESKLSAIHTPSSNNLQWCFLADAAAAVTAAASITPLITATDRSVVLQFHLLIS
jgi:hypothetical protein